MLRVVFALLCVVLGTSAPALAESTIESRYTASCMACHASGAAGAPKSFDEKAWAPRMEKGMDTLLLNVKNGMGAMPPKGICFDCTDDEFRALIEYMAEPQG